MATSQVKICNMALNSIGHTKFIGSIDEDSDEADVCREMFDQVLDEVLEAFAWPFATRRSKPAQLTATTLDLGAIPSGWTYAYALPADCVTNGLRQIYPGTRNPRRDEETPFAVEFDNATGQLIVLTDDDAPEFIYTARQTTYALMSASFARAVAFRLAEDCVLGLRKDPKLGLQARGAYRQALADASSSAKRSTRPDEEPVPDFIANR